MCVCVCELSWASTLECGASSPIYIRIYKYNMIVVVNCACLHAAYIFIIIEHEHAKLIGGDGKCADCAGMLLREPLNI